MNTAISSLDTLAYRAKIAVIVPATNTVVQPEMEAMRRIERAITDEWVKADKSGERYFPHEFFYKIIKSGALKQYYQIDPKNSWMVAAAEKNLPIICPGWEDATLGNMFAGEVLLTVIVFLLPWTLALPFYALEMFVGIVQSLVFAGLTLVFAASAVAGHGEGHGEGHDHGHEEGAHH